MNDRSQAIIFRTLFFSTLNGRTRRAPSLFSRVLCHLPANMSMPVRAINKSAHKPGEIFTGCRMPASFSERRYVRCAFGDRFAFASRGEIRLESCPKKVRAASRRSVTIARLPHQMQASSYGVTAKLPNANEDELITEPSHESTPSVRRKSDYSRHVRSGREEIHHFRTMENIIMASRASGWLRARAVFRQQNARK